jgi:ATP-dependent Clp protease protease subunit
MDFVNSSCESFQGQIHFVGNKVTPKHLNSLNEVPMTPAANSVSLPSLAQLETTQKLLDKRMLVISEGINSSVAKRVIEQLFLLEANNPQEDIWIFLNSPGGEVNSGYGIYDTMKFVRPRVRVLVTGLAASIATVILLGADKDSRFATPNSQLLIHQPLIGGNIQGQASDIEITANEILKTRERIAKLYHEETKMPLDKIQRDIERDYWMSAQEAQGYGLITTVVSQWSQIL